ncbi:MAG: hypothetical protein IT393_04895 [Nitrospirae bacterium]|nr:hypothetical protein [Nitrospirota bacterium]
MGCVTEISTIHEIKGRVRFSVPQIKWSIKNSSALKTMLSELRGIYHYKVCVHAGTVIIYFNRRVLSRDSLVEAIHHCPFPESAEEMPKCPPPVHIKRREGKWGRGIFHHNHFILLDLLKHGVMAGGAGGAGGHLPLAISAFMAWRYLKNRNFHHKGRRRKSNE